MVFPQRQPFSGPGLSVQALGCYCDCKQSSTLTIREVRLSTACCALAGAEGLAALSDLSGESIEGICLFVDLRCNDLCVATSSAEVPFAGFLSPASRTLQSSALRPLPVSPPACLLQKLYHVAMAKYCCQLGFSSKAFILLWTCFVHWRVMIA